MDNQRLEAYDWSTQTAQLAEVREEWKCCTMGHGVQFVTTIGPMMMPELLAGIYELLFTPGSHQQFSIECVYLPIQDAWLCWCSLLPRQSQVWRW